MAKRVKQRPPMFVSLIEALNYVMYDKFDFSGFDLSDTEMHSALLQQGGDALARHWRGEREAKREIFRALRDGELIGKGRLSVSKALGAKIEADWRKWSWGSHALARTEIDPDFWSEDGIDWNDSVARNPGGEYADIVFVATELLGLWKAEDVSASIQDTIPASDRVVPLNHNSAAYQDAVTTLDEVIAAAEKANDLGSISPEDRVVVLSTLKRGRELLGGSEISFLQYKTFIGSTLIFVASSAAGGVIGDLAVKALSLLNALLGFVA